MSCRRESLRARLWACVERLFGRPAAEPPRDWSDEEPALVPVGLPRRPWPSSAVALDLPDEPDEPDDVDAYGTAAR